MHLFNESVTDRTDNDTMVPTWAGKSGKPGKNGENFFQLGKSQGILNRLEKVREIYPKYWKNEGNFTQNVGKVRTFFGIVFYSYFLSDFLIEVCFLNRFLY